MIIISIERMKMTIITIFIITTDITFRKKKLIFISMLMYNIKSYSHICILYNKYP